MKVVLAGLMAASMLFGCGAANAANSANSAAPATESKEEATTEAAASAGGIGTREVKKDPYTDSLKIAWIPSNATEANGTAWGKGIQQELESWSNVEFNIFDGQSDAENQNKILADLIAQGYDGIILQAINSGVVANSVVEAEQAGIPVVNINLDVDVPHAGLVAMTDVEAGYAIGEKIAEALPDGGNVCVITAKPGASRGERLQEGFEMSMANHPELKVLDAQTAEWNMEKANTVMNDYLTNYGDDIDAVFCHNDQMAEGAGMACQSAGRNDIIIWGANGETKALEYIEQGIITGTVYTNCYNQGATAARLLMMYIGSDLDTSTFDQTPVIKMPPMTVDASNVDSITEDMRW
ncbi:MAG: sugar ABC transporter substrate-binding protein [Lachnospiraceae bacterium]|nr:sugar ABC transporter substrate-binding protein [Lachnospiraceae bacterium]